MELKVQRIGRSIGVIVPYSIAKELGIIEGQSLILYKATDDRYYLTCSDSDLNEQFRIASKGIVK